MISKLLLTIIAASLFVAFCQGQEISAEKKKQDSTDAVKNRKENPAVYQKNIAPIFLEDKTCIMRGHGTVLRITNEGYGDSVRRNYQTATMPGEISNVVPLARFVVGGEKIKVQFRTNSLLFSGVKSEEKKETHLATMLEMQTDKDMLDKRKIEKQRNDSINTRFSIRISINNQAIFQWRPISSFTGNLYKSSVDYNTNGKKIQFWGYEDFYDFVDTTLAINDQLFIEIKDNKTGWMEDSYNITRKEMSPKVSLVLPNNKENVLAEKKTSF